MSQFKIHNLECSRRDTILFQDINFKLEDGDMLQIDGANGCGKSSLMQICSGLLLPSAGQVLWNNNPIQDCRHEFQTGISYIGHQNAVKSDLSALENMQVIQALSGNTEKIIYKNILDALGLKDMADVLIKQMSAGQKRKMALTRLFLTQTKLWLLDEPFNALDKFGKELIEKTIVGHCKTGGIVIFATHQTMQIDGYTLKHVHLGETDD